MSEDKVDRAIEAAIIEWLQWNDFKEKLGEPDYPQHTLTLISRRKNERDAALKMCEEMVEALEYISKTGVMAFNISQIADEALESYHKFKGK